MSTITYKCPNCDADLTYRPATGDFGCEYCGSSYTGEQLNELIKNQKIIDEQKESEGTAFDEHAVVYTCPNCGAEVITDDTTAATFCFYCHNPVILKGRLSGGMAPDKVIPFSIPKEKVKEQLISWCKSKKYIDDGFFSEMQLEKLTGVYFPFWLVDSDVRATMTAKSNSLKVWVVGDIEYTETSVYALTRSGDVKLSEITVKALADPAQYSYCRPIVVGDAKIMEQAKKFVGREDIVIHRCQKVSDALFTPGTIDVLHLDLIEDVSKFQLAKVSVEGGNAAFQCVKKVIELAMAGEVDATCTNALNKEAMNKALEYYHGEKSDGYTHFDGHTEIYATYTHTKKYTMMLAHHDLRVVHVSTHVSLREACDRVKKDRVLEVIEIAHKACRDMGIQNPRIAVAGLNPHCGENGLFGREEIEEITPAIEAAKAEGITGVVGPCPPDSVFSQALGGWYDIVVCMYHDQGHIPLKTVGFVYDREKQDWKAVEGVNVTLGLPIIRASVDHGTDFYHAGKGNGNELSLVNAIKYAVKMTGAKN